MFFQNVEEGKPDPVFGMQGAYLADRRPKKVNLMVGIYRDDHLKAALMPSVQRAKEAIFKEDLKAEYLPIGGLETLCGHLGSLIFGEKRWERERSKVYSAHTPGGTGALRVGAEFLAQEVAKTIYISRPTWGNHTNIFEKAQFKVAFYPYYSEEKRGFDFDAMLQAIEKMEEKSVILLHAACHNPTGSDPTEKEWKILSQAIKKKRLLPFFDFAYQGFGDGIEKDAAAIQIFFDEGIEMLIAYSCSKNFSLYCQRVGALFVVSESGAIKAKVESQVLRIIRGLYSNPPSHGALIVSHLLDRPDLRKEWREDLEKMRIRISQTRTAFIEALTKSSKARDFSYLGKHKGMFSYLDLDKAQVKRMIDEFGIYLLDPGRISIAGLSRENIPYVVESFSKVLS